MPTLPQPEAYIGNAGQLFSDTGEIKVDSTREFVQKFIGKYAEWVGRITANLR